MKIATKTWRVLSALGLALGVSACQTDSLGEGNGGNGGTEDADCHGASCSDTGDPQDTSGADATSPPDIVSIAVEPPQATVDISGGQRPEVDFNVVATLDDGTTQQLGAPLNFTIDSLTLGRIDASNGTFVASGVAAGQATVSAELTDRPDLQPATGTLTVTVAETFEGPQVPADVAQQFGQATTADDPTKHPEIVYPLDGAVMPQNVYPADIQWLRGTAGDLYKITLAKPHATVTAYLKHTGDGFGNHWLVDEQAWRVLAQSDPGQQAEITVERLDPSVGAVYASPPVAIAFAKGAVSGSVYYWDIAAGRIKRINDGTAQPEAFMPTPPLDNNSDERCVGCHTVSNSGRYMVGRLGGGNNIGAVFDLTTDLTGDPPPTVYHLERPGGSHWWFSSWSPDDSRLVVSTNEGPANSALELIDPMTGQFVAPQAGALPTAGAGGGVTHPAWSPDGSLIAYVANANQWGGTNTTGDIATIDVTGPDSFGASRVIKAGTDIPNAVPAGQAASYPTWSPNSELIAFAHGQGSRSESHTSALYIMRRDGTGLARLNRGNGGANSQVDFQPRFAPFETEDYFWLSFLSRRDYGNAERGTRGDGRQQIWVMAIEKSAPPGVDPSRAAYWLPGQDTESMNIAAYWAPRACRPDGESCTVGGECCGGECVPDEQGALVCSPPPPDRCREVNETCTSSGDCCGNLTCQDNVCNPFAG